jgi:hypothetical protein
MTHHYLAEIKVFRNDAAKEGKKDRYGNVDDSSEPSKSRELVNVYVRATNLELLRVKVETLLQNVDDIYI